MNEWLLAGTDTDVQYTARVAYIERGAISTAASWIGNEETLVSGGVAADIVDNITDLLRALQSVALSLSGQALSVEWVAGTVEYDAVVLQSVERTTEELAEEITLFAP